MKKYKSLISLLLVLGMLLTLWAAPVHADGRIIISGGNVASTTPPGGGNYTKYDTVVLFGPSKVVHYFADVPTDGAYHISVDGIFEQSLNLTIGCEDQKILGTEATGERKEVYIGKLNLKAGRNVLDVENLKSGAIMWLYNIYLDPATDKAETDFTRKEGPYRESYIPGVIQAEDFDLGPEGSYSEREASDTLYRGEERLEVRLDGGKRSVVFKSGDWANYTFKAPVDGNYELNLMADVSGELELYIDDQEYPILAKTRTLETTKVGVVSLKAGTHTLKIRCSYLPTTLDYLSFVSSREKGYRPIDLAYSIAGATDEEFEIEETENKIWKQIYVSASAKTTGNGSAARPYKTIEEAVAAVRKVNSNMRGDIVVNILPGEYVIDKKIELTAADSGKNGYNVIYKGTDVNNKPLIFGGTRLTGWQEHENGVWKTKADNFDEIRQLYINGFNAQRARSKYIYTFSDSYDDPETQDYLLDGYGISKLNIPDITKPKYAELVYNQLWTQQRVPVKKIVDGGDKWWYVFDQPYFNQMLNNYSANLQPLAGGKCYIENAYELIDEYGEFYFDRDTKEIFYYPFPEEDMKTAETIVGRTELMLTMQGESKENRIENIILDNIDFRYGTWADVSRTGISYFQSDCIIDENTPPNRVQSFGRHVPAVIDVDYARGIVVRNCNFQNLGCSAIAMSHYVNDSKVYGNVFKDLMGTAVMAGTWNVAPDFGNVPSDLCENIVIANNVVKRNGLEFSGCPAIAVYYARNTTVAHNDIEDTPYTAITLGWGWGSQVPIKLEATNHKIINNRIEDISKTVRDGGHIYMLSQMNNTLVKGNYCIKSKDYGGVYLDTGTSMITITENVFKDCVYDNIAFGRGDTNKGNRAFKNWADQPQHNTFKWIGTDSFFEAPQHIIDGVWPEEANEVMENAGLQDEYKHLLKGTDYPEWRTLFTDISPKTPFASKKIMTYSSLDWMPGGEGVGYHESREGQTPRTYSIGLNNSVGDSCTGEWLAYEVDIAEESDYIFELTYSLNFTGTGDYNSGDYSGILLYVDDELVFDHVPLASTGSWNAYVPTNIGEPIHLTKGKHILKVEFYNGWSFEKFRLIDTNFTQTEAGFDDGTLLKRK